MRDWYWVTDDTKDFMSKGYLLEGETIQDRVGAIANRFEELINRTLLSPDPVYAKNCASKFITYMARGYYSLSSPVWSNFGRSGLPISCNNVFVEDNMASILGKVAEVGMQTKHGAGTSAYLGALRHRGAKIKTGGHADGPVHFVELFQAHTTVISQGNVRRGSTAVYLPVEHPDIEEWLTMRREGHPIQEVSFGVTITNAWMRAMLAGDRDKRRVWMAILRKRSETGYPYLFWTDTVNENTVDVYKDLGMTIWSSNLCTEVALPSSELESFVCDLSSLNCVHLSEALMLDAVYVLTLFLDMVMEEYIEKTNNVRFMEASNRFARRHRAIGIGTLGYHSALQARSVAFESVEARELNVAWHQAIQAQAMMASQDLAVRFGEPELLVGYGRRNTTVMTIAPTTSSSFILGAVSPSIEPLASNYFTKNLAKGKYTYRNPYLTAVLESLGKNTDEVWASILVRGGSVQHLDWLPAHDKEVFKTFSEISQLEIVIQAADRQQFIDQSQSLNISVPLGTPPAEVHQLLVTAWELGVKTMYYQRSANPAQELARSLLLCTACEA